MTLNGTADFSELVGFQPSEGCAAEVHGTTVLGMRFDQGCLVFADRRATMGNLIMYDQAEKILPLDDRVLVAVSGAYARSVEVARYLRHAFKYYERLNLLEISTEGKLMEISKALKGNLPMGQASVGLFLPIACAYDPKDDQFGVYFFDAAGARFQSSEYACAGSGSERVRGLFEYMIRREGKWATRPFDDVLMSGLRILDIAADLDSATGGFRKIPPSVYRLDRSGVSEIKGEALDSVVSSVLAES